jgi:hypothetical protein
MKAVGSSDRAQAQKPEAADDVRRLRAALKRLVKSVPYSAYCQDGKNLVEYTDMEWDELCAATKEAAIVLT